MRELTQDLESVSYKLLPLEQLKPHPRNAYIYGSDEDVTSLVEMIHASGWVKPLVLAPTGTIISGHRLPSAALELGLKSVFVEVRQFPGKAADELEALLLENATRVKTIEQKVREAEVWKEAESIKAKDRQGTRTDIQENFPGCDSGQVGDLVARRVGSGSGHTYEKAAKVVRLIDQEAELGRIETAQVLRKVLNEQSVDAAHILLKKPPQERRTIANLIINGEAKPTFQAAKTVRQKTHAEFNDPLSATFAGFAIGDWVEVSAETEHFETYIGLLGQVEQVWPVEQQVSVNFEGNPDKIRFYPHELTLIAKAPPPNPFQVGDIVFVDIDRHEAASVQERKWNGFWGKVRQIAHRGSLQVDVGSQSLQLLKRDLKPIDTLSGDLSQVVERVLRLRKLELDEIEERMLDVLQLREWFTPKQLIHLENIYQLYPDADFFQTDKHLVSPMRGH